MTTTPDRKALTDKFLAALLDLVRPLQTGADPEVSLEALIDATGILQDRLRLELDELRIEQTD